MIILRFCWYKPLFFDSTHFKSLHWFNLKSQVCIQKGPIWVSLWFDQCHAIAHWKKNNKVIISSRLRRQWKPKQSSLEILPAEYPHEWQVLLTHLCWHQATFSIQRPLKISCSGSSGCPCFERWNPYFSSQLLIVLNHHASIIFECVNHCFFQPFLGG